MLDLLKGIRVVSFNHFLLGPMGIQALGDLGADVISIENARGRLAAPLERRRHLARRAERAAPVRQPQQAQHRHRSEVRQGPRAGAAADRYGRCRGGELPARRDGEAGARLRSAEGAQAGADLRVGVRLRPGWPVRREARPGPARPGSVRHDGHHWPGCDWAATGRRVGHRSPRRRAVRHGHTGGDRASAADRARLPGRCQPDAGGPRPAGRVAGGMGQLADETAGRRRPFAMSPAGTTRPPTGFMPPRMATLPCRCRR